MFQQIGNILQQPGGIVPGVGLFNPGNSGQILPEQLYQIGVQQLQAGAGAGRLNGAALQQQAQNLSQEEMGKRAMTQILMNLAGQGSGRGIPSYNQHEQNGRVGLVDPSLTGQQTALPIPFNRQWDLAANLQAYVKSLPADLYSANEQVRQVVDSQLPQAQGALKHKGTIYEKVPDNFVTNRLNLALQRKREQSLYAVV